MGFRRPAGVGRSSTPSVNDTPDLHVPLRVSSNLDPHRAYGQVGWGSGGGSAEGCALGKRSEGMRRVSVGDPVGVEGMKWEGGRDSRWKG